MAANVSSAVYRSGSPSSQRIPGASGTIGRVSSRRVRRCKNLLGSDAASPVSVIFSSTARGRHEKVGADGGQGEGGRPGEGETSVNHACMQRRCSERVRARADADKTAIATSHTSIAVMARPVSSGPCEENGHQPPRWTRPKGTLHHPMSTADPSRGSASTGPQPSEFCAFCAFAALELRDAGCEPPPPR